MSLPATIAVTLEEVKAQLNQTLASDDALLEKKILAAQIYLESLLGFALSDRYPSIEGGSTFPATVPEPLREAVCQLGAWWYQQREAALVGVSAGMVPLGFSDVVANFRDYSWGESDE